MARKKKHGTTRIPTNISNDPQLDTWVRIQRVVCKEQNWIDLLNDIGFDWSTKTTQNWMEMYGRLVTYKQKYGSTNVPSTWQEDTQLATWVKNQRLRCKEKHRVDLLNRIGVRL